MTSGEVSLRMDFKVFTPEGVHSYQDDASYALNSEGPGTLHVRTAEGKVILYGPTGWRWLQEVPPPAPGDSGPATGVTGPQVGRSAGDLPRRPQVPEDAQRLGRAEAAAEQDSRGELVHQVH
jgi:hypothetical protein